MREKIELCDKYACVYHESGAVEICVRRRWRGCLWYIFVSYIHETRNSLSSFAFLYPHEAKGVKAPSEKKERKK